MGHTFRIHPAIIRNTQHRISLTKFRLSNHKLMIESGRHQHIEKSQRFCHFCPGKLEDELHFLLECKTFEALREELLIETSKIENTILQIENRQKFLMLLTNPIIIHLTADYISRMSNAREFLLNYHKNPT